MNADDRTFHRRKPLTTEGTEEHKGKQDVDFLRVPLCPPWLKALPGVGKTFDHLGNLFDGLRMS
jgi:hypothetical protein